MMVNGGIMIDTMIGMTCTETNMIGEEAGVSLVVKAEG